MKQSMPDVKFENVPLNMRYQVSPKGLAAWNPGIKGATDEATIGIFEPIGQDFWTGDGITAKRVAGILRNIGDKDVTVKINSPGGDVFEGIAIYNLLKEHKGSVTVQVLGLAASAASIIAMAGNDIQIARSGFLMIHNAWFVVAGDRNELRDFAEFLEPFDKAIAEVYAARNGADVKEIMKAMDSETWMNGSEAINQGYADSLLESDEADPVDDKSAKASAKLDYILASAGMSRTEINKLINELKTGMTSYADVKLDCILMGAGMTRSERKQLIKDLKTGMTRSAEDDMTSSVDVEPLPKLEFTRYIQ